MIPRAEDVGRHRHAAMTPRLIQFAGLFFPPVATKLTQSP
jgi:hypothetical protein